MCGLGCHETFICEMLYFDKFAKLLTRKSFLLYVTCNVETSVLYMHNMCGECVKLIWCTFRRGQGRHTQWKGLWMLMSRPRE